MHDGGQGSQSKGEKSLGDIRPVLPIKGDGRNDDGQNSSTRDAMLRGDAHGQQQDSLYGKEGGGLPAGYGASPMVSREAQKLSDHKNSSARSDGTVGGIQGDQQQQQSPDGANPGAATAEQSQAANSFLNETGNSGEQAPNQHAQAHSETGSREAERNEKNAKGGRVGGSSKAKLAAHVQQQIGGTEDRGFSDTMADLMQHLAPGLDVHSTSFSVENQQGSDQPALNVQVSFGNGGKLSRTLDFGNKTVQHGYFQMPTGEQGAGTGKRVLASQIGLYQKLGLQQVNLHANINVGGYAWAKYGFLPSQGDWGKLSQYFSRQLNSPRFNGVDAGTKNAVQSILSQSDPRAMWALSDSRLGKQLMLGSSWNGSLNLNDPEAMGRFNAYVGRA